MWLGWILGSIVYAHLAEYGLHRWVMHKPILGKGWWFTDHAIDHHAKGRNDLNISLAASTAFLIASPLIIGCLWLSWSWVGVVALLSIGYSWAWTTLHSAHHDLGAQWLVLVPVYRFWRRHHLRHHDTTNRNFGAVFPWTDFVFGTKV